MDVYRGEIPAEKNFIKYALFVSFFPQLVAGPIERSKNLLPQLNNVDNKKINFEKIRDGICLILYGLFLKMVIADRIAIIIDSAFDYYTTYGLLELLIAVILFPIQILCDFNGYSTIAKGSARMLGITLMDNFRQPYLATSIKDFWRRWHISLTSWFTDYLYIPLGGNRKGFSRQLFNTMVVFLVSGLWHGASWHYVVWGMIHGIYLIIESVKSNLLNVIKLDTDNRKMRFSTRIMKSLLVYIFTTFAWVFFRASSCKNALLYFRQMLVQFHGVPVLTGVGFKEKDYIIVIISISIMFIVDILHEKEFKIRQWLYSENLWFRWLIYLIAFWTILLFGVYGEGFSENEFIYFQF